MNRDIVPVSGSPLENKDDEFISIANIQLEREDLKKQLKSRISRSERRKYLDKQKNEIIEREKHDDYLRLLIYPFIKNPFATLNTGKQNTESGYELYTCDPFYDNGSKNFDCLIYKEDSNKVVLVFVEVKTGLNRGNIVKEFKEKCEEIEKNYSEIDEIFPGHDKKVVEYVLCVDAMMVSSIQSLIEKEIINSKYRMIVWQIGSIIPPHRLNLVWPTDHIKKDDLNKMIHSEKEFNTYLRKSTILLNGPIYFFPQSHPVTKLKAILGFIKSQQAINKTKSDHQKYFFTDIELRNFCKIQLINQPKVVHDRIFNEIVDLILKIKLVKKIKDGYTINEDYQNRSLRVDLIERLWLDYKLQNHIYKKSMDRPLDKFLSSDTKSDFIHPI